jgi:hypothetical protein
MLAFLTFWHIEANAQCKRTFSIDYVGIYSEQYDACNAEMRTTFEYHVDPVQGYLIIFAEVDNTPFQEYYKASVLCPVPPCDGSVVRWNHCEDLKDHSMVMDVYTSSEATGFSEYKLTADYFAEQPE